jgi:hypothetical protein
MRYKDSVEDHVHELLSARLEGIYALFGQLPDVLEDIWINVALGHMDTSLPSGEIVDVIVLLPASPAVPRRSAVEVLAEAPGQRLFKTAADVAAYLREERDAWES